MLPMLLKMSAVTAVNVLLTVLLWSKTKNRKLTAAIKLGIGLVYGLFAVLSTHFAVNYSHMLLNVRDMGPLAAGLFFDPISGIIAGLIGGIERYIAGTWWGIGAYTRVACSVSTCLSGFVAAFMHICIFKRKKPSATFAFSMGAVMEVFHMYVVFITHRDDMSMAFYVVRTVSIPMIVFTGLGLALSSTALKVLTGEWKNPFRRVTREEVPVSHRFQLWLLAVTLMILLMNFLASYLMQTQTALQDARETLNAVSGDIRQTYLKLRETKENVDTLAQETAQTYALGIAKAVEQAGGPEAADDAFLDKLRGIYGAEALTVVGRDRATIASAGSFDVNTALLRQVLDGGEESQVVRPSSEHVAAGARCGDGMVQVVVATDGFEQTLNLSGLNEALSFFHVGSEGTFDILRLTGAIIAGDHRDSILMPNELAFLQGLPSETIFTGKLFGMSSLCRVESLEGGATLLAQLPMTEVYANRDAQAYESAFADILLFAVIYVLISMLVQKIVVNNLDLVNASLHRITNGDLNEVVDVRNSSEFASLSNDINQTVDVLKGYIDAAEKRIEQELELARTIQESALPRNFTFPRNDFELYATMDPAKEVGGDFYDFFFVAKSKLALVVADVSGKGIPGALFMMRGKTAIRSVAESGCSPAEVLCRANNALYEGNDAEMFITAWIGIIDLDTGLMRCANAGHEYPILMHAGGDYELFRDMHGLALAAMEGVRFKEYELQFEPGDRLFVYTDGIPEAINEQVEQYGTERMVKALNALKGETMRDMLPALRQDILDFVGDADQFDDITMLGFAYFGRETGSGETPQPK